MNECIEVNQLLKMSLFFTDCCLPFDLQYYRNEQWGFYISVFRIGLGCRGNQFWSKLRYGSSLLEFGDSGVCL